MTYIRHVYIHTHLLLCISMFVRPPMPYITSNSTLVRYTHWRNPHLHTPALRKRKLTPEKTTLRAKHATRSIRSMCGSLLLRETCKCHEIADVVESVVKRTYSTIVVMEQHETGNQPRISCLRAAI